MAHEQRGAAPCSRWVTEHQSKFRWPSSARRAFIDQVAPAPSCPLAPFHRNGGANRAGAGALASRLSRGPSTPVHVDPMASVLVASVPHQRPPFHAYSVRSANALVPRAVRRRPDEDTLQRVVVSPSSGSGSIQRSAAQQPTAGAFLSVPLAHPLSSPAACSLARCTNADEQKPAPRAAAIQRQPPRTMEALKSSARVAECLWW